MAESSNIVHSRVDCWLHFTWVVDDAKWILVMRVCLCVCLFLTACPHYCTDLDVTWGNGRGCPLVGHYWADLHSVHGFRCYENTAQMHNVSEFLYLLCAWFVDSLIEINTTDSRVVNIPVQSAVVMMSCLCQGRCNSQWSSLHTELRAGETETGARRRHISKCPTCPHQSSSNCASLCELAVFATFLSGVLVFWALTILFFLVRKDVMMCFLSPLVAVEIILFPNNLFLVLLYYLLLSVSFPWGCSLCMKLFWLYIKI